MAGVGGEPAYYDEEIGTVVDSLVKGGGGPKGGRDVLQGGGVGGTSFGVRDVGDDPPHGTGHWGVAVKGINMNHWERALAVSGGKLIVPTFGGGNAGDGV